MSRFDRDLADLLKAAQDKKNRGLSREDYPDGLERDAYDVLRFLEEQEKMACYEDEVPEEPYTYEEVLDCLKEHESMEY